MVKRTKAWTEYLEGPQTEARYELDIKGGKVVDARVIGYFTNEYGVRKQFVRWDFAHGEFHKDCLYEKEPKKQYLKYLPLKECFNRAKEDLRSNWRAYKKTYIKNHQND